MVTMNETPLGPDPREERKPERDDGDAQYDRARAAQDDQDLVEQERGLRYVCELRDSGVDLSPREYETFLRHLRPPLSEQVIRAILHHIRD